MKFSDIYSDIEDMTLVTNKRNFVKRSINRALDRISGLYEWPWLLEEGFFTTADDYTAGTVSINNGSKTLTGASTTFTSSMVGRKVRIGSENAFYEIVTFNSTTELLIDQPYQGSNQSGATYRIYQDEYRLNADVDIASTLRQVENGFALINMGAVEFDLIFPASTTISDSPSYEVPIGRRRDTYETGTVSGTAGATTITGASTAWLSVQGLSRGSRLRVGTEVFTVRSIASDTSLTIYETIVTTFSVSAYILYLDNLKVQVFEIPNSARNIYYRYHRKPTPLVNDYDEPDLPPTYNWLLIRGSLIEVWEHKGDDGRSQSAEAKFLRGVEEMKRHYFPVNRLYHKDSQVQSLYRRREPRYPRNFDVSVSL